MSDHEFVPGQRWVSATEPDLGLGIVDHLDGRLVVMRFPAADVERTYAVNNAPLGRVRYAVDDEIRVAGGAVAEVKAVQERGSLIFYVASHNGEEVVVPEALLDAAVRFAKPQDRLFAGQIDRNKTFRLRGETLEHLHRLGASGARGLIGPRVQLLLHQMYIAHTVAMRHAPRVLLADEVGLGKTIEAGLIIHQRVITGRASRVLVLVPDALVHQWLVEMRRRFELRFSVLDAERLDALDAEAEGSGANPFESTQLVITPLSLIVNDEMRLLDALAAPWDMVIVDEAHHLSVEDGQPSIAYSSVAAFAEMAPSLILLTATPEQLGVEGHFARLKLLDPHRYTSLEAFRQEEAGYKQLRGAADALVSHIDADSQHVSEDLARELDLVLDAHDTSPNVGDEFGQVQAQALLGEILDRHGTGRVLFRNLRAAIGGFPIRTLKFYDLGDFDKNGSELLNAQVTNDEASELPDLNRVAWVAELLKSNPKNKFLITCVRDETALALERHLRLHLGVRSAVFHAGADLIARDRAAAYFAEPVDGAQVLVCSEIGSEGRNFQFAQDLVLFDLPSAPEVLEQRIGRIDRIGQGASVRIHYACETLTAEHRLFRWYSEALDAFETPCAIGERMHELFGEELAQTLNDDSIESEAEFDALIERGKEAAEQLREDLSAGRDRLIELNSMRDDVAHDVVTTVRDDQRVREFSDYMERLFDYFGVEHEHGDIDTVILRPGQHMLNDALPGLPEDGMTGTVDRSVALAREDVAFLTWEHPLIDGAMDGLVRTGAGNTALATLRVKALSPGTLLLEARYVVHCPAPARLQIQRFLPEASVRIVCDEAGRDLTKALTPPTVDKLTRGVPPTTALELVKQARDRIAKTISIADDFVQPKATPTVEAALAAAKESYGAEIARMRALAQQNAAIRDDEVTALEDEMVEAMTAIADLEFSLDSLRVLVVTAPV